MKRDYPLIIIDNRKDSSYPYDFAVVLDREFNFISKIQAFRDEENYRNVIKLSNENEKKYFINHDFKNKKGGLIIEVLEFFTDFELTTKNRKRIISLLKRAMKKFVFGSIATSLDPKNDLGIENQITQQKLSIERAKANYEELLRQTNGDKQHADFVIQLAEATLISLETFKDVLNENT